MFNVPPFAYICDYSQNDSFFNLSTGGAFWTFSKKYNKYLVSNGRGKWYVSNNAKNQRALALSQFFPALVILWKNGLFKSAYGLGSLKWKRLIDLEESLHPP